MAASTLDSTLFQGIFSADRVRDLRPGGVMADRALRALR